uniref:Platelet-derived growth factor (PDGF) family profile domain-containing protein n=1 Tax=Arion vulgaris TaxID=1028688 RepID=A0A0B7B9G0_9EUPU
MIHRGILVYLLLLGYSLCWISGQPSLGTETTPTVTVSQASVRENRQQTEDAEDYQNSATYQMQNINNFSDFINLLTRNGNPVDFYDIFSNTTNSTDGRLHINTGDRIAQPDECSPRDTTVRLTFENSHPNWVYFPRCTQIERCGGCCASTNLECVPSYIERVTYKVLKAEVPFPGSPLLEWKGEFSSVILERHMSCRVQCTLTSIKCGPKKEFLNRQCECKCRNYLRCQPPLVWDPEHCECKCAEVLTCCKQGELCGLVFNKDTCECGIDVLHIRNNITREDIESYNAMLENATTTTDMVPSSSTESSSPPPGASSSPTVEARIETTVSSNTTTSSTAANTTTTEYDPCPRVTCPINHYKHLNVHGSCSCRRNFFGSPRGGSRNTVSRK